MPSVLSCVSALRARVESQTEETHTPEQVLELFLPMLELLTKPDESVALVLLDALSDHLMSKVTPHLDTEMRRELEKRAQPYCSAGDLDALPMDLLSHSLSFLSYPDRMPVECVCRSLFALSRNTPVICDSIVHSTVRDSHRMKNHVLMPIHLHFNHESAPLMNVKTKLVKVLTSVNNQRIQDLSEFNFPSLSLLKFRVDDKTNEYGANCPYWKFIHDNRISDLEIWINSCRDLSSLIFGLSKCNTVRDLCIGGLFSYDEEMTSDQPIYDLSHFQSLSLKECSIPSTMLNYVMHPGLKEVRFYSDDNGFSMPGELISGSDWSSLKLPELQQLRLDEVTFNGLSRIFEIIDECSPVWTRLDDLYIRLENLNLGELEELIKHCSVLSITKLTLSIRIVNNDCRLDQMDLRTLLKEFPNLKEVRFELDQTADSFSRAMPVVHQLTDMITVSVGIEST